MGHLNKQQIDQVAEYLKNQGVTFEPLKNELIDHFILDIESKMKSGPDFDRAFQMIQQQLVKHQLLTLEQETMEAISKQNTLTTRITYIALALLLLTSGFKLLHLPGTTALLFSSVTAFAASLLTGAITGIRRYKDKLGSTMLLAVIGAVILHIMAWAFIILQLPGSKPLLTVSLVALVVTFSSATYQFATNDRFSNSILSYLHDKYSPGIERVLMIVLAVAALLKISAIAMGYPPNVGMVLLVFVISGGVLHYFASQWQMTLSQPLVWVLILTFIIGEIPALGTVVPYEWRAVLTSIFYILIGCIALYQTPTNLIQKISVFATIGFYILFQLNSWKWLPNSIDALLYNPVILLTLMAFLFLNRNTQLVKIFFITAIAHYLLEYPLGIGFGF